MNLKDQFSDLLRSLSGRLGPSSYDVAWMARVPADGKEVARWPELIDWLLEHQWLDGSWGGVIRYYHDRILCTLAGIIALKERGTGQDSQDAIKRGERYIWHNLHRLRHDPFELVGFELILPTLLVEASSLELDVPQHTCGYGRIRREKLRLIPPALLYSPRITTVHSLEFMGREGNIEQLRQALAVNGSLGNSPATTSYYLLKGGDDPQALSYLQDMLNHHQHVVPFYPFRTFELAWVLHGLASCYGSVVTDVVDDDSVWEGLKRSLGERGAGFDPTFGIEDGDTTSMVALVLGLAGYSVDPAVLSRFEDQERQVFRTYDYERNVSISTNIHALEALSVLPEYPDREGSIERVLAFLLANRMYDTYWLDKWHASPYYTTAHAILAISRTIPEMIAECGRTVSWLVHTQREDGSWGFFEQGTAEETAYALMALMHCRHCFSLDADLLHRAVTFLYQETQGGNDDYRYPPLWIVKSLYVPQDIVRASIMAALMLYEGIFGSV